jgi:transposase
MTIIGIDISKKWFDGFCGNRGTVQRFDNTLGGWRLFAKWAGPDVHVVMEASGPYYLGLASWLVEQRIAVSVVNPLVIRRYGQMQLSRTKTDAKDAELIASYGKDQAPPLWTPPSAVCQGLRQLMSLREGLLRQQSILVGQGEAFGQNPMAEPLVLQIIREQRERIQAGLERIDRRLEQLALRHYRSGLEALLSIPGIGKKTAIMLLCITDGFKRFDDSRKLVSYVGICPRIWESGSSIKGRGSICRLGSSQLRKLLYMCSWSAKTHNPACRQMYERLKAKGKPERVIKVAIAHKLLRQAFAVGKKQQLFNAKLAMAA